MWLYLILLFLIIVLIGYKFKNKIKIKWKTFFKGVLNLIVAFLVYIVIVESKAKEKLIV